MKYNFNLTNEELETIKESMYEKDLSGDYIEEGRKEALKEVIQKLYHLIIYLTYWQSLLKK